MEVIEQTLTNVKKNDLPLEIYEKKEKFIKRVERKSFFGIKRLFDILCSIIGIFALIPVALITKITYVLSGDKKSIFYKQKRIGKNGKFIYILKLRSMVYNADEY